MKSDKSTSTRDKRADLVIIGGGGAGLAAAVTAAELGIKKITVLEKRGVTGGNTALAVGMFAAESPVQRRALLNADRDELFHTAMNFAYWKINPLIVRAFIDKSGDTIRWLEKKGLSFELMSFYPDQLHPTWHAPKGRASEMVKMLAVECKKYGVTVLTNAAAQKLLFNKKGGIAGVSVKSGDSEYNINSGNVIIATGGYGGNKQLVKKYCASYRSNMNCLGLQHTGDGLIMALEAGAATEGLGLLLMAGPQVPGSVILRIGKHPNTIPVPLMSIVLEPRTLWLNNRGERFADESIGCHHYISSNPVNRQPDNTSYTIFDHELVKEMTDRGIVVAMGYYHYEEQRSALPGLERELKAQAAKGMLKIANSWDGIASWMGAGLSAVKASVAQYNKACDSGHDPVFAKTRRYMRPLRTPPFYAIRANSDYLDTIGGIKINHRMEVLNKRDEPIPGLYAAGVVTGGWEGDNYCALLSGSTCGFAINSGRIASENAAARISR